MVDRMDYWSLPIAFVILGLSIVAGLKLTGWPSWIGWAVALVLGLFLLYFMMVHVVWYGLLYWLRDYF